MTENNAVTLMGVGDILIQRDKPETIFAHVVDVLRSADIIYANCEQMYTDKGAPGEHATYSDPANIPALVYAGINVVSLANNSTLNMGPEGLLDTMARLEAAAIHPVGAGINLAEAHRPVIIERRGTRVGFLGYGCIGPVGFEAEEDKPGHAPLRSWTIYEKVDAQPATSPRVISSPYWQDMLAMVEDVRKLKAVVDVVVVCTHWGVHFTPRVIPMYCQDIGHAAIDAGADLVLGTHPHILKGIEVYKNGAIFYSTGNFALEIKKREASRDRLNKHYGFVPDPEYPTYPLPTDAQMLIIVKAIIENGKIKRLSYIPCHVNKQAEPEIIRRSDPRGQKIFDYIQDISMSEDLPVHFAWDGDEVLITP
jgi:hypothetical protein